MIQPAPYARPLCQYHQGHSQVRLRLDVGQIRLWVLERIGKGSWANPIQTQVLPSLGTGPLGRHYRWESLAACQTVLHQLWARRGGAGHGPSICIPFIHQTLTSTCYVQPQPS
jgi:hypothetical protein